MEERIPLKNRTGWVFSDGKAGNEAQLKGITNALGLKVVTKPVNPRGLQKIFSPWIGVSSRERFGMYGSNFCPPWPDFAFAVGRLTTPYIRELKRRTGNKTFTVILQNPKVNLKTADLFWVPLHDKLRGDNVITSLTAPHIYTLDFLNQLGSKIPDNIAALKKPRLGVFLGGSNGDYFYTSKACHRLANIIERFAMRGYSLMVTPSRRTETKIIKIIKSVLQPYPHIFWSMQGHNPYPDFLAHADGFLVPADSINMTGEPCVTGRPVYVFYPDGGSAKFKRFHESLENYGATRPINDDFHELDTWSYKPLNSSETIANQILEKWNQAVAERD